MPTHIFHFPLVRHRHGFTHMLTCWFKGYVSTTGYLTKNVSSLGTSWKMSTWWGTVRWGEAQHVWCRCLDVFLRCSLFYEEGNMKIVILEHQTYYDTKRKLSVVFKITNYLSSDRGVNIREILFWKWVWEWPNFSVNFVENSLWIYFQK